MRMRRALTAGVTTVLALGVVSVGLLWAFQRSIIYQPDTSAPPTAGEVIPGARDVTLSTDDGLELTAWLVPPKSGTDRQQAVLYAQGNGGNRVGRADIAQLLSDRGFTVLLLDYRGYGGNPGDPSEEGTALDARAAVDALRAEGFELDRIIYFGESIGTGVVAQLQTTMTPAGVVLRSPFTELADVASAHFPFLPVKWLLRDKYPVVQNLAKTDVPVSVIYGDHDTIVSTALSEKVAATTPNLFEELVVRGDHNDPVMAGPEVADAVVRLADSLT